MFNKTELINYMDYLINEDELTNTLVLALKNKYYYVYKHCLNVCSSSYLLAHKLKFSNEDCINISLGGILHDIGKLNISSKILYKPGALDSLERSIIERHGINAINLLNGSRYLDNSRVHNIILYHHERYDGEGYCSKLRGKEIPIEARIISICDSFDAMISCRNYSKMLTLEEAKNELVINKNTQFDADIVDGFLEIVDGFYNEYYDIQSPLYINDFIKRGKEASINWETILEELPDIGVILIDKYDEIKFCNKFAAGIRDKKQKDIVGNNFIDFHKKHRNNTIKEKLSKVKSREINGWERTMKRGRIYLENKYIAIHDKDNEYNGLLMITRDVSEKEEILRLLEKSIENLNVLVQANSLLTHVCDFNRILDKSLDIFQKIINIDCMDIIIREYMEVEFYTVNNMGKFDYDITSYVNENIKELFNNREVNIQTKRIGDKLLVYLILSFEDKNRVALLIQTSIQTVIQEREEKLLEVISGYINSAIQKYLFFVEIEEKAIKDNLTNIYNRQYFQKIIDSLDTSCHSFGVILVDINNLKYINDTFGHLYGDLIIKTTAQILKKSIRKEDYVFRYGGDEFIILMSECSQNDITKVLKVIDNNIINTWDKEGTNIELTVSMGYSISSKNKSISEVIRLADENMYIQKRGFKRLMNLKSKIETVNN